MAKIKWNENGWTAIQDADAKLHVLEINARAEDGKVVEVRIRHNDGEEQMAVVTYEGNPALPMDIKEFQKLFEKKALEIK